MIKNCQAVWKNCLEIIRQEVQERSFNTWFLPIKPVKLQDDVLTIEVPSPFFYEWLEEHYVFILKKAILAELGPKGKLEYSIVVDKSGGNEPFMVKGKHGTKAVSENNAANLNLPGNPSTNKQPKLKDPFSLPHLETQAIPSQLNPNYTFETYIEGACNQLARSAGMAIAQKPGFTSFNPFVVYGGVGLGKTHLVQSIGNEIKALFKDKFVLYVTSEQFTTQFIEALKSNDIQSFTNFYLQVDVLIMDDIQFLAGKEKTQENFFHIFNRLHQNGKQIIMTSDCPPRSLQGLQERLLSRFKWGLTTDLYQPDYETRVAIVYAKIASEGVSVPDDVIDYIAHNVDSNIRELHGVLISLIANASLMRKDIDLDLAKSTLINIVRSSDKTLTIDFIQQIVADYFKVPVEELKSKTRKKEIATARQIAMYFSQNLTKFPLKQIGESFGGRDHSTVVHATKTIKIKATSDSLFEKMIKDLTEKLQGK
jgi:chromosomal replication initiator protein